MTDCIRRALGLEQVDLSGKLIMIDEHHGSDANFLVNAVLSKSLEKGRGICLVLFHNTFGHYHNIGMKLGYNLNILRERGGITVVEPMKSILYSVEELGHDSVDPGTTELEEKIRDSFDNTKMPCPTKLNENLVQHLFASLRDQYYEVKKVNENVTIIIDDITHLIDLNLSLKEVWFYTRYLRSLMEIEPKLSMCILGHSYQTDANNCYSNMVVTVLRRMAHLYVCTEPLSTGHSREISGLLSIVWRVASIRKQYHWADRTVYLYKLLDRQIKLFTPGGTPLQS
ncbi:elongator complex protein 6 [Chelonus insularis]|uniref:elongator complex protein 6 n=1 Tax=Chelonus insularis TaxID=460826 RepID=UPI00158BE843|nr:elongator complex protein 6 [Chelonus insularis]